METSLASIPTLVATASCLVDGELKSDIYEGDVVTCRAHVLLSRPSHATAGWCNPLPSPPPHPLIVLNPVPVFKPVPAPVPAPAGAIRADNTYIDYPVLSNIIVVDGRSWQKNEKLATSERLFPHLTTLPQALPCKLFRW